MQKLWTTKKLISATTQAFARHTELNESELEEMIEADEISAEVLALMGEEDEEPTLMLPLDSGFVSFIPSATDFEIFSEGDRVYARLAFPELTCTDPDELERFICNKYSNNNLAEFVTICDDVDVLAFELESSADTVDKLTKDINKWLLIIRETPMFQNIVEYILKFYVTED